MAPTDVMNRPAWQFWMDARIRAAGTAWENTQREHATHGRRRPGTATDAEKQDLVDDQEQRAARREQHDDLPGLDDQLAAVDHAGDG
jgi:hypothetical protein